MSIPVEIRIYSRANCHLCEEAKSTIERVRKDVDVPVTIDEIDVDKDETLRAEYGDRVPYICIDGRPTFKYEVDEAELRQRLFDA